MSSSNSTLFNLNIERAILSAVIFDPTLFDEISPLTNSSDFYLPFHQHLYMAINELNIENKPFDEEFLKSRLLKNRNWDEVTFFDVLGANPISNIDVYIEELKERSKKRKLSTLAINVKKDLAEEKSSEDVIGSIAKTVESLDEESEQFDSIGSIVDEFETEVKEAETLRDTKVLATGIDELDRLIDGGIEEGEVVIVGARPSMGKTATVTTMISNWVEDSSCGVLFDSLEMGKTKIVRRIISTKSDSTLFDLKRGWIKDYNKYKRSVETLKNSSLIIHDKNGVNFNYLRNKAKRVLRKNPNIRVWIIDHIGEIQYGDPRNLRIEMGEVMSGVREIAKEFKIGVIVLSQLNREVTNRKSNRPTLADLRESGELEQKADKVILLHRESYYQRGEMVREPNVTDAEMIVAKNRDGATGVAKLKFEGKCARFISNNKPYEIVFEEDTKESSLRESDKKIELPTI